MSEISYGGPPVLLNSPESSRGELPMRQIGEARSEGLTISPQNRMRTTWKVPGRFRGHRRRREISVSAFLASPPQDVAPPSPRLAQRLMVGPRGGPLRGILARGRRPTARSGSSPCRRLAVRPEGADHQWRKNPPESCRLVPVADERLVRVTVWVGAS